MGFKFFNTTKILFGKGCLTDNSEIFRLYGKRALIVTGKSSGYKSGVMDDLAAVLNKDNIEYQIFDKVNNNPDLDNVADGGRVAAEYNADFIIGVGGGSPIDASKAISVLATNSIDPQLLFTSHFSNEPLPVIAVPTTAGTGSEVTQYSVLTRPELKTKKSFGNESTFPKVAFLDPRYTESMEDEVTIDTAVDALSHAVEGYVSKRSSPLTDLLALESVGIFSECMEALTTRKFDYSIREKLLYSSMLAGLVISQTGTTIIHSMGYPLTFFKGIPHGRANGLLMKECLAFNYPAAEERINKILDTLKMGSLSIFGNFIGSLFECDLNFNDSDFIEYSKLAMQQRNVESNVRNITGKDMAEIYRKSFK